nr:hypothetical protein [uncultured Mediterranean phage uvMED]BAR28500.1 hypothetical protein [uncultured Mediterranean phage uvMED]
MAYTTINKSTDYFNTHLYTGNDSTNNQTSLGMTPDLVWVKCRNHATPSHYWVDKVRGDKKYISSNATTAEQTDSNTFDLVSGGFNLAGGNGWTNLTGRNYVAWNWKAGGGQGSSNTDGSVNTTYTSVNTTSGVSISKYTNPASGSPFTIGHGLGSPPKMIIIKNLSASQTWGVWNTGIAFGKYLRLDSNAAEASANLVTATSNTTFSTYQDHHSTGNELIAYCFAEKKGFSKFGSYKGNGSDNGTFVYTGFKPAFILVKNAAITDNWSIFDNKRLGYNAYNYVLYSDITNVGSNGLPIDILSNGFKWRTSAAMVNGSGNNCIYMAFAEAPLVGSNNVPATAR